MRDQEAGTGGFACLAPETDLDFARTEYTETSRHKGGGVQSEAVNFVFYVLLTQEINDVTFRNYSYICETKRGKNRPRERNRNP